MANNPYTSQKQAAERELLRAKNRYENATSDSQKKVAQHSVQLQKERLLVAKQREANWKARNK